MRKFGLGILALLAVVLPAGARPSIQFTGVDRSGGQAVNSYSNCVPYVPTRYVKVAAPRRSTGSRSSTSELSPYRALGDLKVLSYRDSANQKLAERWVSYSTWDDRLRQWIPAQLQLSSLIEEQARSHGIDPLIIEIIVAHESAFNPSATSGVGAQGLMQLMPETAADLGVSNAYDPVQNVAAGTRYFASLYRQFGDLALALAAYNAGPGNVMSYGTVPPFAETQNYVYSIGSEYLRRRKRC